MLHCCIVSCILLVFIVLLMTTVNVQDSVRIKRQESSFDKIISEAEKVENSDQAMNSMSALSEALSNYYATLNVGPNDSTDLNSEANLNKHEVQKLLDTIQQVSEKIENEEHAVSAMDSLCNVAKDWKETISPPSPFFEPAMLRNHMDQILAVMNDLAPCITDSKNAVLVMTRLTDNFDFFVLNQEQFETLVEIMKRLTKHWEECDETPSVIHCLLSYYWGSSRKYFFPVLDLTQTLIKHINTSNQAAITIEKISKIITMRKLPLVTPILKLFSELIDRIEDSEVESVKHALNTIRNMISQDGDENHKIIAREIQSIFDKRFPNLHC